MVKPVWIKIAIRVVAGLLVAWIAFVGFVTWSMYQPPEKFAGVMSHMPGPVVFLIAPFETLWMRARAGHLKPGDQAPDFNLLDDAGGKVTLAGFRGQLLVLYFYPKDDTSGCTKEAINFNGLRSDLRVSSLAHPSTSC